MNTLQRIDDYWTKTVSVVVNMPVYAGCQGAAIATLTTVKSQLDLASYMDVTKGEFS